MKRIQGKRPNQIPDSILTNPLLAIKKQLLPNNYNFEIEKTLWRIQETQAKRIGLQFPEGLQMFACILCDILKSLSEIEDCIVLADIVFGACCVEDLTASELNLDLLIHYGHSCLIPINETCMKTLYVFVDIQINVDDLVKTLIHNFADESKPVALVSTVQFVEGVYKAKQVLLDKGFKHFNIPQAKPRTTGELLGCTSPNIKE
jgi:2-(3-amino-3-carboxypropyl)histidine synthase